MEHCATCALAALICPHPDNNCVSNENRFMVLVIANHCSINSLGDGEVVVVVFVAYILVAVLPTWGVGV